MPSRSQLIDDYLRAGNPVPAHAEVRERVVARRPCWALAAVGGVTATAAVVAAALVVAGFPGTRDGGFLSPQQAVAAVADSLNTDGILHWKWHERARGGHDSLGAVEFENATDYWIDMETGASKNIGSSQRFVDGKLRPGAPTTQWYNGSRTRWRLFPAGFFSGGFGNPDDRRPVVLQEVRRRGEAIPDVETPVDQIRRTLDRAAAGQATVVDAGTSGGVPVSKVIERQTHRRHGKVTGTFTQTTWIERAAVPRILEMTFVSRNAAGRITDTSTLITDAWKLYPSTSSRAAAQVASPHFDRKKYVVRVEFRGPRKR